MTPHATVNVMDKGIRNHADQQHQELIFVSPKGREKISDLGRNRSHALRIRSPLLYRLSYKARREKGVGISGQIGSVQGKYQLVLAVDQRRVLLNHPSHWFLSCILLILLWAKLIWALNYWTRRVVHICDVKDTCVNRGKCKNKETFGHLKKMP